MVLLLLVVLSVLVIFAVLAAVIAPVIGPVGVLLTVIEEEPWSAGAELEAGYILNQTHAAKERRNLLLVMRHVHSYGSQSGTAGSPQHSATQLVARKATGRTPDQGRSETLLVARRPVSLSSRWGSAAVVPRILTLAVLLLRRHGRTLAVWLLAVRRLLVLTVGRRLRLVALGLAILALGGLTVWLLAVWRLLLLKLRRNVS